MIRLQTKCVPVSVWKQWRVNVSAYKASIPVQPGLGASCCDIRCMECLPLNTSMDVRCVDFLHTCTGIDMRCIECLHSHTDIDVGRHGTQHRDDRTHILVHSTTCSARLRIRRDDTARILKNYGGVSSTFGRAIRGHRDEGSAIQ